MYLENVLHAKKIKYFFLGPGLMYIHQWNTSENFGLGRGFIAEGVLILQHGFICQLIRYLRALRRYVLIHR